MKNYNNENVKTICEMFQMFPEKGDDAIALMASHLVECKTCPARATCKRDSNAIPEFCEIELKEYIKEGYNNVD